MEKYLVFALEKEIPSWEEDGNGYYVSPCFELIKEFDPIEVFDDKGEFYPEKGQVDSANDFARQYSKDHGVRTVVVKGSVFGD
jgi:hypothetical protein